MLHSFIKSIKTSGAKTYLKVNQTYNTFVDYMHILKYIIEAQRGIKNAFFKAFGLIKQEGFVNFISILFFKLKIAKDDQLNDNVIYGSVELGYHANYFSEPHYIPPQVEAECFKIFDNKALAIHIHLYYLDQLKEITDRLQSVLSYFDVYVSIPKNKYSEILYKSIHADLEKAKKVVIEPVPNRGRNIAPLIIQFGSRLCNYDFIAHFHTKRSLHNDKLADWSESIYDLLLGCKANNGNRIAYIVNLLAKGSKVVYPEGQRKIFKDKTGWSNNYVGASLFLKKYTNLSIENYPNIEFPEGCMFWARTNSLKDFLLLPLKWSMFPHEPIAPDGTLAHVLERLLLVFANQHEGINYRIHSSDSVHDYKYYEERKDYSDIIINKDIKILSYYLPQFYCIPENDYWHGKGFTEWTKVRATNPLFDGHYQQNIPHEELGYYKLDSTDILRKQAAMMQQSGIYGQIFYHYWFNGKKILEKPAELLLKNQDIEMPYCFCWANENWTRTWDGNEKEILLEQVYSANDAKNFIEYMIPFFHDRRYIRIVGRPLLFVYRPASLPDPEQYIQIWGKVCEKYNLKKPYVVAILTRGANNPNDYNMDGGAERVLHDWTGGNVRDIRRMLRSYQSLKGSVLFYKEVVDYYCSQNDSKAFEYYRSAVPNFDNTPRYRNEAILLHGSTPELFQEWIEKLILQTKENLPEDRRFICINAWNEWAESAHLEPDSRYGYAYLNSIGRALSAIPYSATINPKISLPKGLNIRFTFEQGFIDQVNSITSLHQYFFHCLNQSTILEKCNCMIDKEILNQIYNNSHKSNIVEIDENQLDPHFTFIFKKVMLFEPQFLEKMLLSALENPTSIILPNIYDRKYPLIKHTKNGSVEPFYAYQSPLILIPNKANYKNYRVRTDALGFVNNMSSIISKEAPIVTTIIRFHKSNSLYLLRNALYCLSAMEDCIVTPLIAAQDLDEKQMKELENLLCEIPFNSNYGYRLEYYKSKNGSEDLRSIMLNKSLRLVKTRYAAFLDFDDLLMSHAYKTLINRLIKTGKAISFGRVYSTSYDEVTGVFGDRQKIYYKANSYRDFLKANDIPLHSFLLDLSLLDLDHISFHDNQRYLEDYYLTLQLFTAENADWESLEKNYFIGDYIHRSDQSNTLAILDTRKHSLTISNLEYKRCEQMVSSLKKRLPIQ